MLFIPKPRHAWAEAGAVQDPAPDTPGAGALRGLADRARDEANWPVAAALYRDLERHEPSLLLCLQRGHMLKEAGLLGRARLAYEEAAEQDARDPEPILHLAILSKLEGDFDGAADLFRKSRALGYRDSAFIESELTFIETTSDAIPADEGRGPEIVYCLSSAVAAMPGDIPSDLKAFLGAAHYSYSILMRSYQQVLEEAGFTVRIIKHPEQMSEVQDRAGRRTIHIGFHPPGSPRYLKGAYNIICVAWEFERLQSREETRSYHALADAAFLLSRAQEVWSCSRFGTEALIRSGLSNVRTVPTPVQVGRSFGRVAKPNRTQIQRSALRLDRVRWVPLAMWSAMQSTLSQTSSRQSRPLLNWLVGLESGHSPTIIYTIFNVHDFRKQVKPLLEAFVKLAQRRRDVLLLLKISCIDGDGSNINDILKAEQVEDPGEMTPALVSRNVLMTTDALSNAEMQALSDVSAYYVCTSHGEGQSLPLLEAMGRGIVPISVRNTAMDDYIDPAHAIVVPCQRAPMTPRLAQRYGFHGVSTDYVRSRDVFDCLAAALAQPDQAYAAMSRKAVSLVADEYGPDRLLDAVAGFGTARSSQEAA